MKSIEGKVAIVTGGASGIGKATTMLLVGHGAKVAFIDNNEEMGKMLEESLLQSGKDAKFYNLDVSNSNQIKNVIDEVISEYGQVDILCNNVGIGLQKLTHTVLEEEWDDLFNVNVKSMFLFSKYTIQSMIKTGGGTIVNTSSVHAEATQRTNSIYAATKGAISAFTRGMAIDYAKQNIRVNAVLPGWIYTEQVENAVKSKKNPEKQMEFINSTIPMGRPGKSEEVAQLILFLSSDLSSFITGSNIPIDGGLLAELIPEEE